VSVIDVPTVNEADPVRPTATLIPAGVDVIHSPLRPEADTVKSAAWPLAAAVTLSEAVRVTPAALAVIVTAVVVLTAEVVTGNVALVEP
jgi:hypothetical protein